MNSNKGGTERRWGRPRQVGLITILGAVLVAVVIAAPAMGQGTVTIGYPWSNRSQGATGTTPCSGYDHYGMTTPGVGGLVQGWQDTKSTNSILCSSNAGQRIQHSDAWGSASSGVLWSPPSTGYYSFGYYVYITLYTAWAQVYRCVSGDEADYNIMLYAGVFDSSTSSWTLGNQYYQIAYGTTNNASCVNSYKTVAVSSSYPAWSDQYFSWTFSGNLYLYSTESYEADLGIFFETNTHEPYNSNGNYAEALIDMGGSGDPAGCTACGDYFEYVTV
jgi:hypothetical protein